MVSSCGGGGRLEEYNMLLFWTLRRPNAQGQPVLQSTKRTQAIPPSPAVPPPTQPSSLLLAQGLNNPLLYLRVSATTRKFWKGPENRHREKQKNKISSKLRKQCLSHGQDSILAFGE